MESLEPRLLLTAGGIQELAAQTIDMVVQRPYDGLVATFKSPGAVSHNFAAIINWQDSSAPDVQRDLQTSGMVRPYGDRFGVFAQLSQLTVVVSAGTEALSVDVPYLVQGAQLIASGRTIPMPVDGNQDPVLEVDDILATFTDANPQSVAEHFSLVVQWGDGSLNTSADRDSYNYPYVWITEDENTHEFQVRGRHGFPTPGAYQIAVRVLEDEHSRAAASSSVTIGQPPPHWPPLDTTWVRMYCDGSSVMGTGDPPLDFNVLDQTVQTFCNTVRADVGVPLNSVELGHYTFLDGGSTPATATAQVQWTPGGDWEPAIVSGGLILGSHTYATPGSYPISVLLQLEDTYVTGDPGLQQCYQVPRARSYTIHSGAFIEAVPPTITTLAPAPVAAGTQVLASDLFSASDLLDNAVATIQ